MPGLELYSTNQEISFLTLQVFILRTLLITMQPFRLIGECKLSVYAPVFNSF